jgi:hypothetical protein
VEQFDDFADDVLDHAAKVIGTLSQEWQGAILLLGFVHDVCT